MFGFLFRSAQATVDNAISQVVNRAIIAVPFLVAAGFLTAAAAGWLHRQFDAETANLILAAAFATVGLVAVVMFDAQGDRGPTEPQPEATEQRADGAAEASAAQAGAAFSAADRDLLMSTLSTAGPLALPLLFRFVMRNLPMILAIAAAVFIATRSSAADATTAAGVGEGDGTLAPAE